MRRIGRRQIGALVLVVAGLSAYAHGTDHALNALVESVVQHGPDALLPPHLSVVLGVNSTERTTPVMQAVVRDGSIVRTFNVSAANHGNLVMLTYDEKTQETKAYLVAATGALRKAVSYQAGAPANERSVKDARTDFAHEISFWAKFERQAAGSK
jgi:hypothetical protein